MFRKNSIFKKILYKNLIIALIPLLLTFSLLCRFSYSNHVKQKMEYYQNDIDYYAASMQSEITSAIKSSDYILNNVDIINGLNKYYDDYHESIIYLLNTTEFINTISNSSARENIVIYTANPSLFENSAIQKMDRLDNYNDIIRNFSQYDINIIWNTDIRVSEFGDKYIEFYRRMRLNYVSILRCRVFLPKNTTGNDDVHTIKPINTFKYEKNFVYSKINNEFVAMMPVDTSSFYKAIIVYVGIFTAIAAITIFLIVLLSYQTTRKTISNIESFILKLSEHTVGISDTEINENDEFELAHIKQTVREMTDRIQAATEEKYAFKSEKDSMEIELLQQKIEPHLLYNSLSMIKLRAFKNKDNETLAIIDSLVNYYRAVLNNGNNFVPLKKELDMIRQYVFINEFSYGKKYNLEIECQPEIADKNILHMMLQPFIENSVIHGLSGNRQNCLIRLSCAFCDPYMVFSIYDNGYGIPQDKLNNLNNIENYSQSFAIKNVWKRIKLYFSEDSSIEFESRENVYTKVTIRVHI